MIDNHCLGSCVTMFSCYLDGVFAARDRLRRTPILIGKKPGGYAATLETSAFPNLDYETEAHLGPGEIVAFSIYYDGLMERQNIGIASNLGSANGLFTTPKPVPEPATLLLLGIGAVSTGLVYRRRKKQKLI